jgi:hypothetical protein
VYWGLIMLTCMLLFVGFIFDETNAAWKSDGYTTRNDLSQTTWASSVAEEITTKLMFTCATKCLDHATCNAYAYDKESLTCSMAQVESLERVPEGESQVCARDKKH